MEYGVKPKKKTAEKPTTHEHSKSNHLCQEKEYGA